jgi:VIT1/CCC1 family predicted Fe2+/Mn2+ transporter
VPTPFAVPLSVVLGLLVLSVLSYLIAIEQKIKPYREIAKHLAIAVLAMVASHFVGEYITSSFR